MLEREGFFPRGAGEGGGKIIGSLAIPLSRYAKQTDLAVPEVFTTIGQSGSVPGSANRTRRSRVKEDDYANGDPYRRNDLRAAYL